MPTQTFMDVASLREDREVARARVQFLTGARVPAESVRQPILASWRRSAEHEVAANRVDPPLLSNPDLETPFARTAGPVLHGLAGALAGQPVSIVLTDQHGLVLNRISGDASLQLKLDRVGLSPGFVYAEKFVGTNGIGTALEVGGPTQVFGHEHFAEHLEDLACAAAPIHHPLTGRTMGVIDLTCRRQDAGSLLLTLARTTAAQVQAALLEETGPGTRLLVDEYLRACHRSASMVLAVGSGLGMLNDRARAMLQPGDQAALLRYAAEALADGRHGKRDVDLPSGSTGRLTCHVVDDGTRAVGLVVRARLVAGPTPASTTGSDHAPTSQLPGLVGRAPVWTHACREAEQHFTSGTWLAVAGEPGCGKTSLLKAIQLRRQPVPRLSVLDAQHAEDPAWLPSLREALDIRPGSVVLQHVDALTGPVLRSVVALLQEVAQAADRPWVAMTMGGQAPRESARGGTREGSRPETRELLALFPSTLEVPALRVRPEDISLLVTHFLARLADGSPPQCSPDAMGMLTRATWPGNAQQLLDVVARVLTRRRSGLIECSDLPPVAHSVSRRQLSRMESLERDAVVRALADSNGDKVAAAFSLGMSRATIYRKIKTYGIVE